MKTKTIEERIQKLERRDTTSSFTNVVIGILCVVLILVLIFQGVASIFVEEKEQVIKFEVTGIINDTNATTYTQLHFECIKYCQRTEQSSSFELEKCYEQCALLGKECGK